MKLSVIIITLNEAANIERCIRSVIPIADEVIVLDSFSTDSTKEKAEKAGAIVHQRHFVGYGAQKNAAVALSTHQWVLNLDADEELSNELVQSIQHVKQLKTVDCTAFRLQRLTNYCGKWIRHCGWYPEPVLRLWNKEKAAFTQDEVHEGVMPGEGQHKIGELAGNILHYSFPDIATHLKKIQVYSAAGARFDFSRGKKCSLLKLVLAPRWEFFRMFFIKKGFLDGYYGYLISRNSAFASFAKYQQLRELYKFK